MKRAFFILSLFLIFASGAYAYDNDGRDANGNNLYAGGPHRAINDLAVEAFIKRAAADPLLKQYQFDKTFNLTGPAVTARGLEFATEGDKKGTFRWWIIEGGFTADEPELYNSFRHFYDPIENDGVLYLTDHLDQLDYVYRAFIFGSKIGRVVRFVAGNTVNPQINAKDWAISGGKGNSFWENPYCWNKGVDYMRQAYASKGTDKQRLFAKSWRALGETMHLLGDMTCVPHVRNDSHPGKGVNWDFDPDRGFLKNDPYELFCTEGLVRQSAGFGIDPAVKGRIDPGTRPDDLFHRVALYTSSHFISADTIAGTYIKNKGQPNEQTITVHPANGKPAYAHPNLSDCIYDDKTGYFSRVINGRRILMMHENWTSAVGWAEDKKQSGYTIPLACVREQASILIPVAVHANAKLLDLYLPRVTVEITKVDLPKKEIKGKITHKPQGAFTQPLIYNSDKYQFFNVYLDDHLQKWDNFKLEIIENEITIELADDFKLGGATRLALELDIGGIGVRSKDFSLGATVSGRVCLRKDEIPPEELTAANPFVVLDGKPVPNVEVTCSYNTPKGVIRQKAVTDKRGGFQFAVPLDTEVTISVRGDVKKVTCTAEKPSIDIAFGWQGHEIKVGPSVSTQN